MPENKKKIETKVVDIADKKFGVSGSKKPPPPPPVKKDKKGSGDGQKR